MLRVLHLVHWLVRGGIEKWLLSMLRTIPRDQCEMDFCCQGAGTGDLAPVAERLGARVFHCPLGPSHFPFARRLTRILREGSYDILHSHLDVYGGFPVWVARRAGVKVIASYHNTAFPPQMCWGQRFPLRQLRQAYGALSISYALRHADLVTGCSRGVLGSLDPRGTKVSPERSRVLYYGVETRPPATTEERGSLRRSLGWPTDTPLVLHAGRFVEQKNHLGLLTIFQQILRSVPTARLLLVGDGDLRPVVEKAVTERGLTEHVRILGLRDDVPALMSACDLFLFPSLFEGFGLVAIEALAAGLPLVGSRITGLTEAVRDGETALLHDVADLEGMARSAVWLLTDRAGAGRMAEAGRAWTQATFSAEASSRALLSTYGGLVSAGTRPCALALGQG